MKNTTTLLLQMHPCPNFAAAEMSHESSKRRTSQHSFTAIDVSLSAGALNIKLTENSETHIPARPVLGGRFKTVGQNQVRKAT